MVTQPATSQEGRDLEVGGQPILDHIHEYIYLDSSKENPKIVMVATVSAARFARNYLKKANHWPTCTPIAGTSPSVMLEEL